MNADKITDAKSYRNWLVETKQTRSTSVLLAHRTTMRLLPYVWRGYTMVNSDSISILSVLRCCLFSWVGAVDPTSTMPRKLLEDAASHAIEIEFWLHGVAKEFFDGAEGPDTKIYSRAGGDADDAANATGAYGRSVMVTFEEEFQIPASNSVMRAVKSYGERLHGNSNDHAERAFPAFKNDCMELILGRPLLEKPLWGDVELEVPVGNDPFTPWLDGKALRKTNEPALGTDGLDWSFFVEFYRRSLLGKRQNHELVRSILVSDRIDWKDTPSALEVINRICEQDRLRQQAKALKSLLEDTRSDSASIFTRTHNNPPEPIEAEAQKMQTTLSRLWAAIDEAEDELGKLDPSPNALKRIAKTLIDSMIEVAKYGAKLGDVFLGKAVEEAGASLVKWGIASGAIGTLAQHEAIQAFGKGLLEFAKTLGGP